MTIMNGQSSERCQAGLDGRVVTVTQVADALGFEYPQHFSRFFKKHTGMQPSKYVASIQK